MKTNRITEEHVRQGLARFVTKGQVVVAEWAPAGTQLRIPTEPKKSTGEKK